MKRNKQENLFPYLEKQRAEKLAEMGNLLRLLREEKGLSVEEVATKTKIQARLVNAIEEGNLEPLPEPIYIQGFLKRYANALGLDGKEFASVFPTGQGFQMLKPIWWRDLPSARLRPIHLYFVYVVVIACAVSSLSRTVSNSPVQATGEDREKSIIKPLPTKLDNAKSGNFTLLSSTSTTNLGQTKGPVRVNVTLKAASWIQVVADGKTTFEGMLTEGTQRRWAAKEKLVVRAGNAGGVLIALNDGQAKQLGDSDTPKTVTFKAN